MVMPHCIIFSIPTRLARRKGKVNFSRKGSQRSKKKTPQQFVKYVESLKVKRRRLQDRSAPAPAHTAQLATTRISANAHPAPPTTILDDILD